MKTPPIRVEDEYGVRWCVPKGAAAHASVLRLKQQGFVWQVLPRGVLLGRLEVEQPACTDPVRAYRLHECIEVLHDQG